MPAITHSKKLKPCPLYINDSERTIKNTIIISLLPIAENIKNDGPIKNGITNLTYLLKKPIFGRLQIKSK